jgi:hypothetical protein
LGRSVGFVNKKVGGREFKDEVCFALQKDLSTGGGDVNRNVFPNNNIFYSTPLTAILTTFFGFEIHVVHNLQYIT